MEAHTTLRVEETVKEADAELSSKEYDYKIMLQQLDQLKGEEAWHGDHSQFIFFVTIALMLGDNRDHV